MMLGITLSAFVLTSCTNTQMREVFGDSSGPIKSIDEMTKLVAGENAPKAAKVKPVVRDKVSSDAVANDSVIDELILPGTGQSNNEPVVPLASGDITLDFNDTPIKDVAAVVLGDFLGAAYLIDANVKGNITLTTATPINRKSLLPLLDAALSSIGAEVVQSGGAYRVRKAKGASLSGMDFQQSGGGGGFLALPLEYIGAAELAKIIRPLLPNNRPVLPSTSTNLLLVGGSAAELDTVRKTAKVFDVNVMARQAILLKSLKNVQVSDIQFELENIFGAGEKGPLAGLVRFMPIERLNAVLVMSPQQGYLADARRWIERLDQTRKSDEVQVFVYYMQHGRVKEMAQTLGELFTGASVISSPSSSAPSSSTSTRPIVKNASAPKIVADESRNALLIQSTQREYRDIKDVLSKLDVSPAQVMIEAQIVEVTLDDSLRFGVQYALDAGGLGITTDGSAVLSSSNSASIAPTFGSLSNTVGGFAYSLTGAGGQARIILDALAATTEVNVVSAPKVFVLDNQTARLSVGDDVPIVTQTAEGTATDSRTINAVQYRSTGVFLEVTPRVNAGEMVTLEVIQNVSSAVNTQAAGTSNIDSPTIQQSSIVSTVAIQNGETVLLGGMIREKSGKGKSGLPILSSLPFIGPLFGVSSSTGGRSELLVMITPRIIRTPAQARQGTEEIKAGFEGVLKTLADGVRQPDIIP
jgi:general secretion pathway protein D